jgi:tripartite-type tricarboxylate transporter receptor subunit TctC
VGRALWPALILVLLAHAVSDVLHHPFLGDTGDAATVDAHLTLWVPGTESGGPSEAVARDAAASLQLTGRPATVKLLRTGGAAGAVARFLGGGSARPADLLVVSSATVADLARGQSDALFGDEAAENARAEALLRRARPLALLAQDTLQLAVRTRSRLHSGAQLLAALRRDPRSHLLAVEGDAWTKVNLGRLVQRAGVPGRVPYRAYPSGGEAALGLESGDADVVLAPSSELRAEIAGGRLRALPWPADGGAPPRAWTAVLEAPGLRPGQHARLRDELARLSGDPHWRAALHDAGRAAPGPAAIARGFLADRLADAVWAQRATARIEGD